MSRFLFAWELGANYGHLARDLPVARRLRDAGHQVLFAVRDTKLAAELLDRHRFAYLQAPLFQHPPRLARPPASYAELLLAEGWNDRPALLGGVRAWRALLALSKADVLVADHAPTALLAAHLSGVGSIAFGSGFEIPPAVSPLPSIRPWESIADAHPAQSEASMLMQVNAVIGTFGGKALACLAELFPPSPILATFPELDHYGARQGAAYVGSIHGVDDAAPVDWPPGDGSKFFVYLRPGQAGTEVALGALMETDIRAVGAIPGLSRRLIDKFASPRLAVHPHAVAIGPLLAEAAVVVCHGGAGTMADALLTGVPLLMMPTTVEQYLGARRVEALGAGIVAEAKMGKGAVRNAMEKLRTEPVYRQAAQCFARKYRTAGPERSTELAAAAILATSGLSPKGAVAACT